MSMDLFDADERHLKINAWNWGVLHELVADGKVFEDERWAPFRFNGTLHTTRIKYTK